MAEKEGSKVGAEEMEEREQEGEAEEVEVKFRLFDGSDIGPVRCNAATTTVAALKDRVVADWPKDKSIIPKTASDVKLISGGKILENDKNVAQCRAPFGDLPSSAITMHVVVQPSSAKSKPEEQRIKLAIWLQRSRGGRTLGVQRRKMTGRKGEEQGRAEGRTTGDLALGLQVTTFGSEEVWPWVMAHRGTRREKEVTAARWGGTATRRQGWCLAGDENRLRSSTWAGAWR